MRDKLFSLEEKVAVVTGASYGLGITFATALADAGANIVATARSVDKLEQTRELIEARGRKCLAVQCDVRAYDQVAAMMKQAWEHFGAIDVLVNNAGVSDSRAFRAENSNPEEFNDLVHTDLTGVWYCCHAAAQYMLRQGRGSIINIGSILGMGGYAGGSPASYFAAKAGVHNLTRMLACEWADRGVRVNAVAPTFFDSEMMHEALLASGLLDILVARHPARRIGEAGDLEGPIVFLASEASRFITGVVLPIDGGLTASIGHYPGPFPADEWDPEGRGHPLMPGTQWPENR